MKFGYTILYVNDVVKTAEFYQKAFSLELKFIDESNQYAEMKTGQTALAFAQEDLAQSNGVEFIKNRDNQQAPGVSVVFVTNDVLKSFEHAVANGATPLQEPAQKPWAQTVAYVADCNGIIVELCSPIEG